MVYAIVVVVFALLVAVVALASLATRLRVPYAILLVLGGLALGFVPRPTRGHARSGAGPLPFPPAVDLLLGVVHALARVPCRLAPDPAAGRRPRPDLHRARRDRGACGPRAGLVGRVRAGGAGLADRRRRRQRDPAAAGVGRRVVTIVEGESMVNDATGLVIYRFAVAAVVGGTFSLWQASWQFVAVSAGGLLIGLAIAWPIAWVHRHLDDAPREITLTLLTPFAAYLLADAVGASGVLAVLAAGLYLSRRSSTFFSPNTRLQADAVWGVLVFLFNGLVFILLGLQLHGLLAGQAGPFVAQLLGSAALISVVVIVARLAWVAVATSVQRLLAHFHLITYRWYGWRNAVLVGWAGMRGAVSLAAALALPLTLADGRPFPARSQLIGVTFGVILFTLVGQGLSLTPLIRALRLQPGDEAEHEQRLARRALTMAALARLEELAVANEVPQAIIADQRAHLEQRLGRLGAPTDGGDRGDDGDGERGARVRSAARRLRRDVLAAERAALIALREQGTINDEVARRLERDLDLEEQHEQQHVSG